MIDLELLAPARNADIGIAAIDCGADAVYIAGPEFGARAAAGNSVEDIRRLCVYAHKFGARIFITINTILYDDELESAFRLMEEVRAAGADAIIVQDIAIVGYAAGAGYGIPLHASTQCAITDEESALFYQNSGFSRLVLERGMSLEDIRKIRASTTCELEFFVHGAICVSYSGNCYISEYISGRSANRGECIQACRSYYDLEDADGNLIARNKALLSMKDYNLKNRLEELAEAGISSFKIEGRLKNISYVRNVVSDYNDALNVLVAKYPDRYRRASFGKVSGSVRPDTAKTFNRGYTELFLDGRKRGVSSMDAPKGMGEEIGRIKSIRNLPGNNIEIEVMPAHELRLSNGDGFSTISRGMITGFRGDVCSGLKIRCKKVGGINVGDRIFRNSDAGFEKLLDAARPERLIDVKAGISAQKCREAGFWDIRAEAVSEDGRTAEVAGKFKCDDALNVGKMEETMRSSLSKKSGHYIFSADVSHSDALPFISLAQLNAIRRELSEKLDGCTFNARPLGGKGERIRNRIEGERTRNHLEGRHISYKANVSNSLARKFYLDSGASYVEDAFELQNHGALVQGNRDEDTGARLDNLAETELMRMKYCIRFELGMCPKYQNGKDNRPMTLVNNGRRFTAVFHCSKCEMSIRAREEKPDRN